jgi:hypothetical protein
MMGHSSLQMIWTRYYAWIPKKTRNDGTAFMATTGQAEKHITEEQKNVRTGKVIPLFSKNDTNPSHPN